MINLNVAFLNDESIALAADSFLKQNDLTSIPVDIEHVIEFNYQMDIVPTPGLRNLADTDGYCSSDCTAIYVDEYVYQHIDNRYRFTLAHELAHRFLHKVYFSKMNFSSVSEWANVVEEINSWDRDKMEYQANMFAGFVLVPTEFLITEFKKQLHLYESQIDQAQSNGYSRDDYVPIILDGIADGLSPEFEVSTGVLSRKIKFLSLEKEIR
jgi:Zn-dependent peptidase ImmA (M78 family)